MAKNKVEFIEYEPKDVQEVFSMINSRQVIALMFHDKSADLFDFLGLQGFKQMHEYQYIEESLEHRRTKTYYTNNYETLISDQSIEEVVVIPEDWHRYTRQDVTPAIRTQYVQKSMEQYYNWEIETKALYERCAAYLLAWKNVSAFIYLTQLIEEVSLEIETLKKLRNRLRSVEYDPVYIEEIQDEYRKKYSKTP